jgi:hypothetical protein
MYYFNRLPYYLWFFIIGILRIPGHSQEDKPLLITERFDYERSYQTLTNLDVSHNAVAIAVNIDQLDI